MIPPLNLLSAVLPFIAQSLDGCFLEECFLFVALRFPLISYSETVSDAASFFAVDAWFRFGRSFFRYFTGLFP